MGTGDLAHEQDDSENHQRRRRDCRSSADRVREGLAHHSATGGHQNQKERAEDLGKQPAPFLGRIVEVLEYLRQTPVFAGGEFFDHPQFATVHGLSTVRCGHGPRPFVKNRRRRQKQ